MRDFAHPIACPPGASHASSAAVALFDALRPYATTADRAPASAPVARAGPACEVCAAPLGEPHRHLLRRERRAILCGCAACAALFQHPASAKAPLRTIGERVLRDPGSSLGDADWATLGVPLGLAFFVVDAESGAPIGYGPSPAGAVELEIEAGAWRSLTERSPLVRALEPDVEALLVRRARGGPTEVLVAPVDACFALAGTVRSRWRGFDGGDAVRRGIDEAFAALRDRSEELARDGGGRP